MPAILERKRNGARELPLLPLQPGDFMTSAEFLRRAEAWHDRERVELIEGTVFMAPPLSTDHGEPDGIIAMWLGNYAAYTPGLRLFQNTTFIVDGDSTVQPDSILCTEPRKGGCVWLSPDRYLCGAPELICEIATSSVSVDLHGKLNVYRRCGVREYLVWRTKDDAFDWFENVDGNFIPQQPSAAGILKSRVFPGLTLDVKAMLARNRAGVLRALERALAKRPKAGR